MYSVGFDVDFKRNPYSGRFFALEGIDGSGKTTQVLMLKKALEAAGHKVFASKNPTDGEVGRFIREILVGQKPFSPVAFQYLFCADRAVQQEEIEKHLKNGEIVLLDRYFWSSVAYGAVDRGIVFDGDGENGPVFLAAFSILSCYNQFFVPDNTIYIRVTPQTAMSRLVNTRHQKDIYDKKEKLEKISRGYDWLINKFPKEFTSVDGEREKEKINQEIFAKLSSFI